MIAFWIALGTDFVRFLVPTWLQLGTKLVQVGPQVGLKSNLQTWHWCKVSFPALSSSTVSPPSRRHCLHCLGWLHTCKHVKEKFKENELHFTADNFVHDSQTAIRNWDDCQDAHNSAMFDVFLCVFIIFNEFLVIRWWFFGHVFMIFYEFLMIF